MVNIRTMELIRRMEACEKRFHRLETFNANNPDLCDEILIKRLQCTLEQQNAESIHSELIQAQQSSSGRKSLDNLLMSSKPGMVLVNQGRMNQEHADASQLLKDVDI